MPLGKVEFAPNNGNIVKRTLLNGESLSALEFHPLNVLGLLLNKADRILNVVCSAGRTTPGLRPGW
jgi:hypothetical protein